MAVSSQYRGIQIGTKLINLIKDMLDTESNYSAFRFITVDDYLSAVNFYKKNGFVELTQKEENTHTRLMFFDMMELE